MTSAFSSQNSVSLCPASFCTSRPKLACYYRYLLNSYFCILVPYDEKDISFWRQFQKVLQVFIEPFNFSFFSGWGINLDYCDTEWFAWEMNRDYSVVFETASKYCILDSFVDYDGNSVSSKGFLPIVVEWVSKI